LTSQEFSAPLERGELVILVSAQKLPAAEGTTPTDEDVSACYRKLARDTSDLSRRDIVKEVARTFAIPPKSVYAIIEKTKSSVE
jgi:hypothetical protein